MPKLYSPAITHYEASSCIKLPPAAPFHFMQIQICPGQNISITSLQLHFSVDLIKQKQIFTSKD